MLNYYYVDSPNIGIWLVELNRFKCAVPYLMHKVFILVEEKTINRKPQKVEWLLSYVCIFIFGEAKNENALQNLHFYAFWSLYNSTK